MFTPAYQFKIHCDCGSHNALQDLVVQEIPSRLLSRFNNMTVSRLKGEHVFSHARWILDASDCSL